MRAAFWNAEAASQDTRLILSLLPALLANALNQYSIFSHLKGDAVFDLPWCVSPSSVKMHKFGLRSRGISSRHWLVKSQQIRIRTIAANNS